MNIKEYEKGSFLKPLTSVKYLFKKPHTLRYPKETKPVADRFRGLHINDVDKCIGCGNCRDICPCAAITMEKASKIGRPIEIDKKGANPVRPKIDYGRCSFCALCVEMCPTGSLKMSKDLIYTSPDAEAFAWVPLEEQGREPGFIQDNEITPLMLEAQEMEELEPEVRKRSFEEMILGFSEEQARKEAMRCLGCGICMQGCPAHMKIPEYIQAIFDGDHKKSVKYMLEDNVLPGICGRICTHRCQDDCVYQYRGAPIHIMWLKRYATDQLEDYKDVNIEKMPATGKKVAIIGGGPSGLSAAYHLSTMGHSVTIFEQKNRAGGALATGIPLYRLPIYELDKEIGNIESMGVEIKTNVKVGEDVKFEDLLKEFDAVYIGIGLSYGRSINLKGEEHPDVVQAIDFLRQVKVEGRRDITKHVIVIGGGNVAMDVARTVARLQEINYQSKDTTVETVSLEDWDIMPASQEEIDGALEEGVIFNPAWGPNQVIFNEDGSIKGLEVKKVKYVFDENHRFNPAFYEDQKKIIYGDYIIESVGQMYNFSFIPKELMEQLKFTPRRKVWVDEYGETSIPGVFAGGDIVETSKGDAISAIANGHRAAIGIDRFLHGKSRRG